MSPLSADAILKIWELGQNQRHLDRALTILLGNGKNMTRDQLAALPVVQRDLYLLDFREQNFGTVLNGFAECAACAEKLEYTLSTVDLRSMVENVLGEIDDRLEIDFNGEKIICRLPDSTDMAAAAGRDDVDTVQDIIVRRCIQEAFVRGKPADVDDLSDETCKAVADHLSRLQDRFEVSLEFSCPACGLEWQTPFDIASFLWSEISFRAICLLRDVHTLASSYGWSQADILAMSDRRRRIYMEAVT